jgi:hypothetical protein
VLTDDARTRRTKRKATTTMGEHAKKPPCEPTPPGDLVVRLTLDDGEYRERLREDLAMLDELIAKMERVNELKEQGKA